MVVAAVAAFFAAVLTPTSNGQASRHMFTIYGEQANELCGISVSGIRDVNRDGVEDFIVGAYHDDDGGTDAGSARVFSGDDGATLYTFHGTAAGGTHWLRLEAGKKHKNRFYWLMGSASGTKFGKIVLPLNYDPCMQALLDGVSSGTMPILFGQLDTAGKAQIDLVLSPNSPPAAAGLRLHHAFLVLDDKSKIKAVSNPLPLTLVQ